eukprot:UN05174
MVSLLKFVIYLPIYYTMVGLHTSSHVHSCIKLLLRIGLFMAFESLSESSFSSRGIHCIQNQKCLSIANLHNVRRSAWRSFLSKQALLFATICDTPLLSHLKRIAFTCQSSAQFLAANIIAQSSSYTISGLLLMFQFFILLYSTEKYLPPSHTSNAPSPILVDASDSMVISPLSRNHLNDIELLLIFFIVSNINCMSSTISIVPFIKSIGSLPLIASSNLPIPWFR